MPAPLLRRRWFRVLPGVVAAAVLVPALVHVLGGPGAREAIDGSWRWLDGSLGRLQVMSWVVAVVVAVVSHLDHLSTQSAQQLEQARWVADKAASKDEQQRRVASRAIIDMEEEAEARGEQVPSFVEESEDGIRSETIDAVVADDEAAQELRDEVDGPGGQEGTSVDDAPHGEREWTTEPLSGDNESMALTTGSIQSAAQALNLDPRILKVLTKPSASRAVPVLFHLVGDEPIHVASQEQAGRPARSDRACTLVTSVRSLHRPGARTGQRGGAVSAGRADRTH